MGPLDRPVADLVTDRIVDIAPVTTLRAAARVLDEEAVGALLVGDVRGTLGIFTERDLVRALADGANADESRVRDHLTDDLLTVDESTSLSEVLDQMLANQVRHVVVHSAGEVTGVVSMRAVLDRVHRGLMASAT